MSGVLYDEGSGLESHEQLSYFVSVNDLEGNSSRTGTKERFKYVDKSRCESLAKLVPFQRRKREKTEVHELGICSPSGVRVSRPTMISRRQDKREQCAPSFADPQGNSENLLTEVGWSMYIDDTGSVSKVRIFSVICLAEVLRDTKARNKANS